MLFVLNCIVGGITPEGKSFLILPFPVTVGTSAEKDIEKQRNNIFTLIRQFANDHKIELPDYYFDFVKCIIVSNFIWAMFNSDNPIDAGLFGTEVAYKMPDAEKGKLKPLDMPVWSISNENIEMHLEGVELW